MSHFRNKIIATIAIIFHLGFVNATTKIKKTKSCNLETSTLLAKEDASSLSAIMMSSVSNGVNPMETLLGDTLKYNITLENTGDILSLLTITGLDKALHEGEYHLDKTNESSVSGNSSFKELSTLTVLAPSIETTITSAELTSGDFAAPIAGNEATFEVTLTNTGNADLNTLDISPILFQDFNGVGISGLSTPTLISLTPGSSSSLLLPGGSAIFKLTYNILQSDIDAGGIQLTVDGSAANPAVNDVSDLASLPLASSPDIRAIKTATVNNPPASLSDIITYSISFINTGNVTLTNIDFIDTFTNGTGTALTFNTGPSFVSNNGVSPERTLLPNEIATYIATYSIQQADVDSGRINNSIEVFGTSTAGTIVTTIVTDVTTVVPFGEAPSISTVMTASIVPPDNGSNGASLGDSVEFLIEVTNTGNVTLTNVVLQNLDFIDFNNIPLDPASLTGPIYQMSSSTSSEGTLLVGETATYTITYTSIDQGDVDAAGISGRLRGVGDSPASISVYDLSGVTSGFGDNDPTRVPILQAPSISTIMTSSISNDLNPMGASLGDTITYDITLENTGNVTLTNVILLETFVDLVGNMLTLTGPTFISSSNGSTEGTLQVGEIANYTANYTIDQGAIDAGGIAHSVLASGNTPQGIIVQDLSGVDNNSNSTSIVSLGNSPSISTIMTSSISNDLNPMGASLGDTITYDITLENTGNVTLTNVILLETFVDLDENILTLTGPTFISSSNGSTEGTLQVGEIANYTANYTIGQGAVDAGGIAHSVIASGNTPQGIIVQDLSGVDNNSNLTSIVSLGNSPSISTIMTSSISNDLNPMGASLGDTITYDITLENTGNVTLTNVILLENFEDLVGNMLTLTGPTFISSSNGSTEGTLQVGEIANYTANYTIGQGAVDAGGIVNSILASCEAPLGTIVVDVIGNSMFDDTPIITPISNNPSMTGIKSITITKDVPPAGISLGDEITFTVTIENTGDTTLDTSVFVASLQFIDGYILVLLSGPTLESPVIERQENLFQIENNYLKQTATKGLLAVGETATYTAKFVVDRTAAEAGDIKNEVEITTGSSTGNILIDLSNSTDVLVSSTLSTKRNKVESFKVYPNPTSKRINISVPIKEITVYDGSGKLVLKTNTSPLSVEKLPKGLYLLCIKTEKGSETRKFIKL